MAKKGLHKYWWVIVVVAGVLGIAAMLIADKWFPDHMLLTTCLSFALIGASFCAVYAIDTKKNWWAIIPGLALFTLLIAGVADHFIGTDPQNDWISVLIIGAGAAVIGIVLKQQKAKIVLHIVALFGLGIGISMSPFAWWIKGTAIAVVVILYGFFIWRLTKK